MYLITSEKSEAGTMETLPITEGMLILNQGELLKSELAFQNTDKVCITSEAVIVDLLKHMQDEPRSRAIEILKDKLQFREILKTIFPDFYFHALKAYEIPQLNITEKCILKPAKGCFGTAVKIIDSRSDLNEVYQQIQAELNHNGAVFSDTVLSRNDFLLEKYISGEEYAVDMFYDKNGDPQIVNIYHHPIPPNPAYLHMIYYTGKEVFNTIYKQAKDFFGRLNNELNTSNLPIHAEFRLCEGILTPVELNPMRFGGMGLGSLIYHALGINPYECYLLDQEPDWEKVWSEVPDQDVFAYFIAYNGRTVNRETHAPDWEKLKSKFTRVLLQQPFDYRTQLAFGIACLQEPKDRIAELLKIEFDDFFKPLSN